MRIYIQTQAVYPDSTLLNQEIDFLKLLLLVGNNNLIIIICQESYLNYMKHFIPAAIHLILTLLCDMNILIFS